MALLTSAIRFTARESTYIGVQFHYADDAQHFVGY